MKLSIRSLLLLAALLVGCNKPNKFVWTGSAGYKLNGIEIELPPHGKKWDATPHEMHYEWDGKTLTVRDLGDGTASVTTPAVTGLVVKKSLVIATDSEGKVTTHPPTDSGENHPSQQSAASDGHKPPH